LDHEGKEEKSISKGVSDFLGLAEHSKEER
jgi:hypothetical protein